MTRKISLSVLLLSCLCIGIVSSQTTLRDSCGERCGKMAAGCSCKSDCEDHPLGCCDDYKRFCVPTCEGRCETIYHTSFQCQCHKDCLKPESSDCCDDFTGMCTGNNRTQNLENAPGVRRLAFVSFFNPTTPSVPKVEIPISKITGKLVECPAGEEFSPCFADPCVDLVCPAHPEARCVTKECGSCTGRFEDGRGRPVDCTERDVVCANGQRMYACGRKSLCDGITCDARPDAVCIENRCGGCYYNFFDKNTGAKVECVIPITRPPRCPSYSPRQICVPRPCQNARCKRYPYARCRDNVCGECSAEFYDENGRTVNCGEDSKPKVTTCPGNQAPCKDEVCRLYNMCPGHPDAVCNVNPCGDCMPEYFDRNNGKRLTEYDCTIKGECGQNKHNCPVDPCTVETCPGKADAYCVTSYCGVCYATFYDRSSGHRLSSSECEEAKQATVLPRPRCSKNRRFAICDKDMCKSSHCSAHPKAKCVLDPCNDCTRQFMLDGVVVNCQEPTRHICADGSVARNCDAACSVATCKVKPEAKCYAHTCDNCRLTFYTTADGIIDDCDAVPTIKTPPTTMSSTTRRSTTRPRTTPYRPTTRRTTTPRTTRPTTTPHKHTNTKHPKTSRNKCINRCGTNLKSGECRCDYRCLTDGNCCGTSDDFQAVCAAVTCQNRCGLYISNADCQCNNDCRRRGNCCPDFESKCLANQSCRGKCKNGYVPDVSCQCHKYCELTKDCCPGHSDDCPVQ